jgi:O-antigen ligase
MGLITLVGVIVMAAGIGIAAASGIVGFDAGRTLARYSEIPQVVAAPLSDVSYAGRYVESEAALTMLRTYPVVGTGPGFVYYLAVGRGVTISTVTIDSPLAVVAKFGIVGSLLLLSEWIALMLWIWRIPNGPGRNPARCALVAYMAFTTMWFFISDPIEDKGFGVGLAYLLAFALPSAHGADDLAQPVSDGTDG